MDVRRENPRRSKAPRVLLWTLAPLTLLAAGFGVDRMRRAAPVVERPTLWIGDVEQGPLTLTVRGPGRLIPVDVRWVTATTSGKVEDVLADVGDRMAPDTPLVQLSNDDLELRTLEAERELAASQAELVNLRAQLQQDRLAQEATVASTRAQLKGARRTLEADTELAADGLISRIELEKDRDLVEELEILYEIEQKRLGLLDQVDESRVDAQEAKVGRLEALASFRRDQLASLRVVASVTGVLQELPLEDGQWIEPGALIAKVVRPELLKAEIKVPQNQARELALGQVASIDVRTGFVPGVVVRIDPSVQDGAVVVDVELQGELPRGARPDMTVEGLIELDRLPDAIYVSRPALAQADSEGTLFLLREHDSLATRVPVRFGRASAREIQVLEGLSAGDRVVLNDMSRWHEHEHLEVE